MSRKKWTSEKIFSRLLTNKTKSTYWKNISELRRRPSNEVYDRAYELAQSPLAFQKEIGIYILAQLGFAPRFQQAKTLELYFQLLNTEENPNIISAVLSSIGHNNEQLNKEQVQQLIPYQNHRWVAVRFTLVQALLAVTHPEAITMLISLSKDEHPDIRNWATFGLGSQLEVDSPAIRTALWERIDDVDFITTQEAIIGLAVRKDTGIIPRLKAAIQKLDYDSGLVLEAIEAMPNIAYIPLLERALEQRKGAPNFPANWVTNTLIFLKNNT